MKTYVITLSKRFPTGHNRAGEPTHFWEKFIIFPWYKPIIDSWETLVELYEKQDYKGVYHLLSSKHAEVMRLQGYEKKQSGIWIKKQ